jgi:hypothetical protein
MGHPRASGNWQLVDVQPRGGAVAAIAAGLLLAFDGPGSGHSGISLPGIDAASAPVSPAAQLSGGEQAIVTKVKPGLAITNATPRYDSEAAAGTGMVINAGGLVLANNHVIDEPHHHREQVGRFHGLWKAGRNDSGKRRHVPGKSGSPLLGMSTCSVCTLICRIKALRRQMFSRRQPRPPAKGNPAQHIGTTYSHQFMIFVPEPVLNVVDSCRWQFGGMRSARPA